MGFDPREGDKVEVSFSAEGDFESWWEGEVRKKHGGFFFVSFPDDGENETNEVHPLGPFSCIDFLPFHSLNQSLSVHSLWSSALRHTFRSAPALFIHWHA
eukprot:1591247-Rhodomonas_salina.5